MTTIINNPDTNDSEATGMGMILGILIVIVILAVLFFVYGWPAIRGNQASQSPQTPGASVNINLPTTPPPAGNTANPTPAPAKSGY